MPDYAKMQIYRFVCNDTNIKSNYVGSTTNWTKRKQHHKERCNNMENNRSHLKLYQTIRDNGGFSNWSMILIEDFPCENRRQAEQREQYWKEYYYDDMGQNRAFRTEEQKIQQRRELVKKHHQENKEILNAQSRAYYQAHREEILAHKKAKNLIIN